jgi:hypothetical protein
MTKALYGILCSLLEELREIDVVFRIETDAQRPGRLDKTTGEFRQFGVDELKNRILPEHRKRLVALQKARKELPKLPQFPDSDFVRSMNKGDVAED